MNLVDLAIGALSAFALGSGGYAFVLRPRARERAARVEAQHAAELKRLRQISEYQQARAELAESEVAKRKKIEP